MYTDKGRSKTLVSCRKSWVKGINPETMDHYEATSLQLFCVSKMNWVEDLLSSDDYFFVHVVNYQTRRKIPKCKL